MAEPRDLTGQRFDRLFVVMRLPSVSGRGTWACSCDCGNRATKFTCELLGSAKTMMCLECRSLEHKKQLRTHGLCHTETRLYRVWSGIARRCRYEGDASWKYYGAKGIDRCPEWDDFAVFHAWAYANGYRDGLSIERLNPSGNYEPANCEWITRGENSRRANAFHRARKLAHV